MNSQKQKLQSELDQTLRTFELK